jgi:hypothetical protein
MTNPVLNIGPRITAVPIIHGSGDFALEVRRMMLAGQFDCVAVPLPPSFQRNVETAIAVLPQPMLVVQAEPPQFVSGEWSAEAQSAEEPAEGEEENAERTVSFVPIDPCQGVIMALRIALGEHIPRAFIDLETARFRPVSAVLPDPYALKKVPLERFAAALLPGLERLPQGQPQDRVVHMAARLRELEQRHRSILLVCSVLDWPWIREAYMERTPERAEHDWGEDTTVYEPDERTLIFLLGELPFITGLYERARAELEDDENLTIDGVKELLMAAREAYRADFRHRARKITPHMLSLCLKYVRNLSLLERRMTPDLYSLVIAAKQVAGDGYALHVAEKAREYPYTQYTPFERMKLGVGRGRLPDGDIVGMISRLPGPPIWWRSCDLKRRPDKEEVQRWQMGWDPYSQCSWPPEDEQIEDFRSHVIDRAKSIVGMDLVRTEKFTTSIKDGIDIRDTLRNWHTGDIYVKELPPTQSKMDCVVMLFDYPADPREYPWRITWYAEHEEESTLAFYATDFHREMVGPGVGLATYGGAMFLYPPLHIENVWTDRRLDFAATLEERLLGAACLHSRSPHIALLSPGPPGGGWRRMAKQFKKKWVHVPLAQFSDSTVQQLRMVHVLNGKEVRSYAARFIRKA